MRNLVFGLFVSFLSLSSAWSRPISTWEGQACYRLVSAGQKRLLPPQRICFEKIDIVADIETGRLRVAYQATEGVESDSTPYQHISLDDERDAIRFQVWFGVGRRMTCGINQEASVSLKVVLKADGSLDFPSDMTGAYRETPDDCHSDWRYTPMVYVREP